MIPKDEMIKSERERERERERKRERERERERERQVGEGGGEVVRATHFNTDIKHHVCKMTTE